MQQRTEPRRILPEGAVPGLVIPQIARWAVERSKLFGDESPFTASLHNADPRILLIVGENASGKSLAFRLIAQMLGTEGATAITISIRERTGSGPGEMNHMRRAFMFGDEHDQSTGANSASVVEKGFSNTDRDKPNALALDEPEMGLSDGYARALGEMIGSRSRTLHANCCGVIVVTHSRRLAQGLITGLGAEPTVLNLAPTPISASDWTATDEIRSVEDLKALPALALERFRAAHRTLGI